ncbi:hypothetical protein ACA910_006935 [Epithemia clementina (nom. ined.)]
MGKHKGRSRKNANRKQHHHPVTPSSSAKNGGDDANNAAPYGALDSSATTATTPTVLLQKIRHADPQTRMAALTALLHNPAASLSCSSALSKKNKTVSSSNTKSSSSIHRQQQDLALFQAVREQVMDSDLTVATLAAACLEEFVMHYQHQQQKHDKNGEENPLDLASAGWYLLLLGRVQEAYKQVCSFSEKININSMSIDTTEATASTKITNRNEEKNKKKVMRKTPNELNLEKQQQWLSFALTCFSTLTCLAQENPVVTERLERTSDLRRDSFAVLWQWLSFTVTPSNAQQQSQPGQQSQQQSLQEQVANLWHVLMEDNPNVVQPWYREQKNTALTVLKNIAVMVVPQQQQQQEQSKLSNLTRLHLVGVLLAAVTQVPALKEEHGELAVDPLLELLKSWLRIPQTTATAIEGRSKLCQTYQQAQEQQQDCSLENAVVRQQSVKKEPARAIARRLKQLHATEEAAAPVAAATEATTMMNEDNTNANDGAATGAGLKRGELPENRTDFAQEWQALLNDWRRHHVELELALEMAANLTSGLVSNNHMEDDDDDDSMMKMQVEEGPLDDDTRRTFMASGNCSSFHPFQELLNQFTTQLLLEWPPVIAEHLRDLQRKVAACLGHLLAHHERQSDDEDNNSNNNDETMDGGKAKKLKHATERKESGKAADDIVALWRDLVRAFDQQPAVASTLVVAIQAQLETLLAGQAIQPTDLDLFLKHLEDDSLSSSSPTHSNNSSEPTVCRDIITLLGALLCELDHSRDVNHKVCQSLIKTAAVAAAACSNTNDNCGKIVVLAESLNVLMDIYGDDDRHPEVFLELQVLGHFQKTLPVLKQSISLTRPSQQDHQEVEYLREIALNASRFIQYKKGHHP